MNETEVTIFWDQLLELIDDGRVVPIIGQDLLTIPPTGEQELLYPYIAQEVAAYLGVPSDSLLRGGELNDVAGRYISTKGANVMPRIYSAVKKIATQLTSDSIRQSDGTVNLKPFPVPAPLLKLAEIERFRLFVSTTFDPWLARSINQARPSTTAKILSFSPNRKEDLSSETLGGKDPIVFHLFGKLGSDQNYAVTQWDIVEYFHALQSDKLGPKELFDELSRNSLLILGSAFGGWLARFFIHLTKRPLSARQSADYIADSHILGDTSLVLFVRHLNRSVEIYSGGGPVDFVNELALRWSGYKGGPEPSLPRSSRGEVFLSYARQDHAIAVKIKTALNAAGVEVFFDVDSLQPGEKWDSVVTRKIRECSLFMPVISRKALDDPRRYLFKEWRLAVEQSTRASFSDAGVFLYPVAVDETREEDSGVPEEFRNVQWQRLPEGLPSAAFVDRVKKLYRDYQKTMEAMP